jgi:hypothetical protein
MLTGVECNSTYANCLLIHPVFDTPLSIEWQYRSDTSDATLGAYTADES